MNASELLSSDVVVRLGWTLLHSLWQIALASGMLLAMNVLLRRRSPQARYLAAGVCMAAVVAMAVLTFVRVEPRAPQPPSTVVVPVAQPGAVAQSGAVVAASSDHVTNVPVAQPPSAVSRAGETPATRVPPSAVSPYVAQPPSAVVVSAAPSHPLLQRARGALNDSVGYLTAAWLAGVLAMGVWRMGGYIAAQRLRVLGTHPVSEAIESLAHRLMDRLGVRRRVRVLQSMLVSTPMVIGHLKPVILLPLSAITNLTPAQLQAVLAHELAHIGRGDYLVNLLQAAVEMLFFYHPGLWWISRQMRIERERCCDDLAVAAYGNRIGYAEALAAIEESRQMLPSFGNPREAMVALRGSHARDLTDRIRRLLGLDIEEQGDRLRTWPMTGLVLLTALLGACLWVSCSGGEAGGVRVDHRKAQRDWKALSPQIDEIWHAWQATQPQREEDLATYNVRLVIDVAQGVVELRDGAKVMKQIKLPNGYHWKVVHVTPDGSSELNGPVWLALPQILDSTSNGLQAHPEAIYVNGDMGDGKTGLSFDLEARGCGSSPGLTTKYVVGAVGSENAPRARSILVSPTTQPASPFKVTLPSGVTVELVGVAKNPSQGKRAWRPDGSALDRLPYDKATSIANPQAGERAYEFAVVLGNVPEGFASEWSFEPSGSGGGGATADGKGRAVGALTQTFSEHVKKATLRYAVGGGPWTSLAESHGGSESMGTEKHGFSFAPAVASDDGLTISVAHDVFDQATRLVAIDKAGKTIMPSNSNWTSGGKVRMNNATFRSLAKSDVDHFELQGQALQWAEFKDVMLQPGAAGKAAREEVTSQPASAAATDASAKQLMQLSREMLRLRLLSMIDANDRMSDDGRLPESNNLAQVLAETGDHVDQTWRLHAIAKLMDWADRDEVRMRLRELATEPNLFLKLTAMQVLILQGQPVDAKFLRRVAGGKERDLVVSQSTFERNEAAWALLAMGERLPADVVAWGFNGDPTLNEIQALQQKGEQVGPAFLLDLAREVDVFRLNIRDRHMARTAEKLVEQALFQRPVDEATLRQVLRGALEISYTGFGQDRNDYRPIRLVRQQAGEVPNAWMDKLTAPLKRAPIYDTRIVFAVPEELRGERGRLVLEADKHIRAGLRRLSAQYPFMQGAQPTSAPAGLGQMHLSARHGDSHTDASVPQEQRFSIVAIIEPPREDEWQTSTTSPLHFLGLRETPGASAGAPGLAKELEKLRSEAMEPLLELEVRAGEIIVAGLPQAAGYPAASQPASQPTSQPETAWSLPHEGIQVRVRAEKQIWQEGETPELRWDIRNVGTRESLHVLEGQLFTQLEVDGTWYRWAIPKTLEPVASSEFTKLAPLGVGVTVSDQLVALSPTWIPAKPEELQWNPSLSIDPGWNRPRLQLRPGPHTVRLAFMVRPIGGAIRVVSEPLNFTIVGGTGVPAHAEAASQPASQPSSELDQQARAWVEDFFAHHYRDVTARQSIEWGQAIKQANGNIVIRYKYLATTWDWDADKLTNTVEDEFIFKPDGALVGKKQLSATTIAKSAILLSDTLRQQRDLLLSQADASLRIGLLKLAEKYPQLKRTNHGPLADVLSGHSAPGEVRVGVGLYPRSAGKSDGIDGDVPERDRYMFAVVIHDAKAIEQLMTLPVYPHLRLTQATTRIAAGDPQLEADLLALRDESMSGLVRLENELAAASSSQSNVGWTERSPSSGQASPTRGSNGGTRLQTAEPRPTLQAVTPQPATRP